MTRKRVHLLKPAVAERIAAGEVIERPASVVKELVENSLDAGATEVQVLLLDGGKELIEILDNGHGIHPEDLPLCVERHATSKLQSVEDLEKIQTLGFRGEALPSVAAVSEFSIISKYDDTSPECSDCYELLLKPWDEGLSHAPQAPKASVVTFGSFLGSEHGTRIQVRGLFALVPARLKFLKSQAAEVTQVREWLERLSLSFPEVGFKLLSDTRTILNLRPATMLERARAILCSEQNYPVLEHHYKDDNFSIDVFWAQGLTHPNSKKLIQLVNRRAVKDRMLQQAMLAPFRQLLLPGQYPAVAMFMQIDPAQIDVNVHPTKTELRFLESRQVFYSVDKTLKMLVERQGGWTHVPSQTAASHEAPSPAQPVLVQEKMSFSYRAAEPQRAVPADIKSPNRERPAEEHPVEELPVSEIPDELRLGRMVGVLFKTYICVESAMSPELILIDQHAAHERIRYEKLRARALNPLQGLHAQPLLLPEAVRFPAELRQELERRLPLLQALGFEAEIFGEHSLLFRAIPSEWGSDELLTRLSSLTDRLLDLEQDFSSTSLAEKPEKLLLDSRIFEKIASEACRSSVKAGDHLEPEQAQALIERLFACEHPWNCPHGRPTIVRIKQERLEEWFQRKLT